MVGVTWRFLLGLGATILIGSLEAGCAGTQQVARATPDPIYQRTEVEYSTRGRAGTIVIDPDNHFLYLVQPGGRAIRYGVGVGAEGYGWAGNATVHSKQEWPDWYPTKEYLETHPKVLAAMKPLQSGMGMPGGPDSPMGARALYLWQGKKDTLYRIHGTNEPWTIGHDVSAGCIRMTNENVADLYNHAPVHTKVIVLPSSRSVVQMRES